MKTHFKYTAILLTFGVLSDLSAQDAYKWKDSSGRVIYGNKAPKSAPQVEGITTRELSTYSSSKALSRMGTEEVKKSMPEGSYKSVGSKDSGDVTKNIGGAGELSLETKDVEVLKNDEGFITSVKVKVVNPNERDALDVSVAFKFADGQLIPAEGPFELPAKGEGEYKIPAELLPVQLKAGTKDELPTAITHGLGL